MWELLPLALASDMEPPGAGILRKRMWTLTVV